PPLGRSTPRPPLARAQGRRRRSAPLILVGLLLVLGCALAFAAMSLRAGGRHPVLALAHGVPAGHVLTSADLRVLRVGAPTSVHLVKAAEQAAVVGRTTSTSLPT